LGIKPKVDWDAILDGRKANRVLTPQEMATEVHDAFHAGIKDWHENESR
jgi:hypothetical protein